jgi:large subunit ribosomal protein L14
MLLKESKLNVVDNSGVIKVRCIRVVDLGVKRYGYVGNLLLVVITKQNFTKKLCKKTIYFGLIVAVKQQVLRTDGSIVKFGANRVILFSKAFKFLGTRITGSFMKEVRLNTLKTKEKQKFLKILSYSKYLI